MNWNLWKKRSTLKTITAFAVLALSVTSCASSDDDDDDDSSSSSSSVTLSSLAVSVSSSALTVGNTAQFWAIGTYSNDTTADLTSSVTWSSSNADMVSIGSLGMSNPVHIDPNAAYTKGLSVSPASVFSTSWKTKQNFSAMIKYYQMATVTATSGNVNGSTDITVSDANVDHAVKSHLTWTSDKPSILNVDGSGDMTMDSTVDINHVSLLVCNLNTPLFASGASCGQSTTLAKNGVAQLNPYGNMSATVRVSYNDPSDDVSDDLTASSTVTFQQNLSGSEDVTWDTSNPNIKIVQSGRLVDATTVDTSVISEVTVSPTNATILKNISQQFKATVTDFTTDTATITAAYILDGVRQTKTHEVTVDQNDVTNLASWTSSNTGVAQVKSQDARAQFTWDITSDSSADTAGAATGLFVGSWPTTNWDNTSDAANPHYKLTVTKAGAVSFSITSAADAMLYLIDSNGAMTASYDQAGPGATEVMLVEKLKVGNYTLIPATYINRGESSGAKPTAEFTLAVENAGNGEATGNYIGTSTLTATIGNAVTSTATITINSKSSANLLTIVVNFLDQVPELASDWQERIYGSTNHGTLNHFYNEISYGQFQFAAANETSGVVNDGIVTVNVGVNHPNPDGTAGTSHGIVHPTLKLALDLADKTVNFAQYDTDGNEMVSIDELSVMFLWAGGEGANSDPVGVWAHKWCIGNNQGVPALNYDGVYVSSCYDDNGKKGGYSVFGARQGADQATVGVIAHELGHDAFSLPDLYDTDYSSGGIGVWGLMSGGSWGAKYGEVGGHTPSHMSAWSKIQSGFVAPTVVSSTSSGVVLEGTTQSTYKPIRIDLTGDTSTKEYFLVEYREPSGYDLGIAARLGDKVYSHADASNDGLDPLLYRGEIKPGAAFEGGILITHIDESRTTNSDETTDHRLVDVEEADGTNYVNLPRPAVTDDYRYYAAGNSQNVWYSGNSGGSFSNDSSEDTKNYEGNATGITINNFGTRGGTTMTFDVTIVRP